MRDNFIEQLVRKNKTTKDTLLKSLIIILGVILTISALLFIPAIGLLLAFLIWFLVYVFITRLNVEYEYIFTGGEYNELDIDIIYNKEKRKRLHTLKIRDAMVICHVDDEDTMRRFHDVKVEKDYSSQIKKDNTYAILIQEDNNKTKIIFEPNEKLVNAIKRVLSPTVFFEKSFIKS